MRHSSYSAEPASRRFVSRLITSDLEILKLDAGDVLHIGDRCSGDMASVRTLSSPVAWLNHAGSPDDRDPGAGCVVADLGAVLEIIDHPKEQT